MTLRPFSVVHSIIYDEKKGKATGVRVIDAHTKEMTEYYARIIFVNASAVNTNLILLNSKSGRFPNGLGNEHGILGKYFAFHNYRAHISAIYEGFLDKTTAGGRPTSAYIPRFRNVEKQETDFLRGYASGFSAGRYASPKSHGFGKELKESLAKTDPGPWRIGSHMMGETIPKETNYVNLDPDKKDEWGIPLLVANVAYDHNDELLIKDFLEQSSEMLSNAGVKDIVQVDNHWAPGRDIHEMGGCRMGKDPKTSLLNGWNQLHHCKNVFVTDGACMTSTANQSPSILYMAFTARAAGFSVDQLKKMKI